MAAYLADRQVSDRNRSAGTALISYTLKLYYESDADYRQEVTDRLYDSDKSKWLTPEEFERRPDKV